jgi:ABC-type nickel/cobalt efflux system permease component RcnA
MRGNSVLRSDNAAWVSAAWVSAAIHVAISITVSAIGAWRGLWRIHRLCILWLRRCGRSNNCATSRTNSRTHQRTACAPCREPTNQGTCSAANQGTANSALPRRVASSKTEAESGSGDNHIFLHQSLPGHMSEWQSQALVGYHQGNRPCVITILSFSLASANGLIMAVFQHTTQAGVICSRSCKPASCKAMAQ